MLENPNKLKIKQQYLRKYKDILGISNLKILPAKPLENQIILPHYLDHIDKQKKQRSKSLRYNSIMDESYISKNSTSVNTKRNVQESGSKIYSAFEMNQIIKQAKLCGLLYDQQEQEQALEKNRKHFQEVRDLRQAWYQYNSKREQEKKEFNKISMEQHYQLKVSNRRPQMNIQQLIKEQQTIFLTHNTQHIEEMNSSSQQE